MAACNLMVQKRVYEYFIPLKYFYLTVDTMLNSYKMFGIEIVLQTCFVRQVGRFPLPCKLFKIMLIVYKMQGSKRLLISFQFAGLDLQGGRQQSGGRYVAPHLRNKVASKYKFSPGT